VLGYDIAAELFGAGVNPVGQSITIGKVKCTIVGVMAEKGVVGTTDYDNRIYIPSRPSSRNSSTAGLAVPPCASSTSRRKAKR
jgi:putative ABC transport system permease protein